MRKILYPLFLLAVLCITGAFFWDDLSSLWKKTAIILGVFLSFWIFHGILTSLFNFFFHGLSGILKSIFSILSFLLILFGIWSFLPQALKTDAENILFSSGNRVKDVLTLEEKKSEQNETTTSEKEKKENRVIHETLSEEYEIRLPENEKITKVVELDSQKEKEEEQNENPAWKKPKVEKFPTEIIDEESKVSKIIAENNEEESKKEIIHFVEGKEASLPASGKTKSTNIITLIGAQSALVYPSEYKVSSVVYTDNIFSLEHVDFNIEQKGQNISAKIQILDGGEKYEKYSPLFLEKNTGEENLFFLDSLSENSITYVTFFEGNAWIISFTSNHPLTADEFYNFLLPLEFLKLK